MPLTASTRAALARVGVDIDRVAQWMADAGLGDHEIGVAELLTGGTQNVLVRIERGDDVMVLRRPPAKKRANSDDTMRREATVLAALGRTDVPHPALIAACHDPSVIGAEFYLMEAVEGVNLREGLAHLDGDLDAQRSMGLSMVGAVAALGCVDYAAVGLGEFGRVDGWLERQVPRWKRHLISLEANPGYLSDRLPHVSVIADWLDDHRPRRWTPGIIHGDVHFGNVLISSTAPELRAIVDWELATIGDPLLDLGHMLMMWPRRANHGALWDGPDVPGLPGALEIVSHYGAVSGRETVDVLWYCVLACYRLGVILEGTFARSVAGLVDPDTGAALHASALELLRRATDLINGDLTLSEM